jgi:hypothetical protein
MLRVKLSTTDSATPALALLSSSLKDRRAFHKTLAGLAEDVTRDHIRTAAALRHRTAARLGAQPTNHLTRLSEGIESHSDGAGVVMRVPGAIFRRALGPVVVQPLRRKWLTIPAQAKAYGRRAGEVGNLRFVKFSENLAALIDGGMSGAYRARKPVKKARAAKSRAARKSKTAASKLDVVYRLKKKTTLPQDRDLLPSDDKYKATAEYAARQFIQDQIDAARAKKYGGL